MQTDRAKCLARKEAAIIFRLRENLLFFLLLLLHLLRLNEVIGKWKLLSNLLIGLFKHFTQHENIMPSDNPADRQQEQQQQLQQQQP